LASASAGDRLCQCSLSYCFRRSHPAFAFRALSHRVLADAHLTRSFAVPNRNGQHPHSRSVYIKRLGHNFALQCSHEQTACLVEKANLVAMTIIEIRPFRNGWQVYEAPGVQPMFLSKKQAIDYAICRACFRTGEDSHSGFKWRRYARNHV
jgi:hypothetical protein